MKLPFALPALAVSLLLPNRICAIDQDANPSLVAQMISAESMLDINSKLLSDDSDWVYDHCDNPHFSWSPGSVTVANKVTFPAMLGSDLTISVLDLNACAMLPPHLHRGPNAVIAVKGSTNTFMIQENGARVVQTTLTPGKMTIFPRASIHSMVNNGCEPAQLISAISMDDPATLNVATALWDLPIEILSVVLGLSGVSLNITVGAIPPVGNGSNSGFPECMARCNLTSSSNSTGLFR